jgi:RHS repeat-associated protein
MWTGNAGDNQWTTPSNWSTGRLPSSGESVVINAAAGTTIQIASATVTVQTIATNAVLQVGSGATLSANTIQASANIVLAGGTIFGGTVSSTGGSELALTNAGGTLDGVTLDCNLDASQASGNAYVTDGLTLNGTTSLGDADGTTQGELFFTNTQTLSGTGSIVFGGNGGALYVESPATTLTIGPGITIDGGTGPIAGEYSSDSIINQGTIDADQPGLNGPLSISSPPNLANPTLATFINQGTLETTNGGVLYVGNLSGDVGVATVSGSGSQLVLNGNYVLDHGITATSGATLTLAGTGSNAGTITATDSTLNLGDIFTVGDLGTLVQTGSTVNLIGTLDNTGTTLELTPATGSLDLAGGTILGGTISGTGGADVVLTNSGGMLDGVTLDCNLDASQATGNAIAAANVADGLTLVGTAYLGNAPGSTFGALAFTDTETLSGTGSIVFGYSENDALFAENPSVTLTIGSGITITGALARIDVSGAMSQIVNQGTIRQDGAGTLLIDGAGGFTNEGTVIADATDGRFNITAGGGFTNLGALEAVNNGGVVVSTSLTLNDPGFLSDSQGAILASGNLLGNTRDSDLYQPAGTLQFDGTGTPASPQLFEAMGQDLGPTTAGFTNNFACGTLSLAPGSYVQLVDQSQNSAGAGNEAVYVNSLIVPAGSTLDLNGLNLYARAVQIAGTIVGGTVTEVPNAGQLSLNSPTPGQLSTAGEVNTWTFFDRAGQAVTVQLDPGSGSASGPISQTLQWAQVELLDPDGNVLATATSTVSGGVLSLTNVPLSIDGTYMIEVQAAAAEPGSTGNYVLSAWAATANVRSLDLNHAMTGVLASPYSSDEWTFSAKAGTQVQFNLLNESGTGLVFSLTGPNGFTGFSNSISSSSLIDLPTSGTYTLAVFSSTGATPSYSFEMLQTGVTPLTLGDPYNGTFAGGGQAQLFSIQTSVAEPLTIALSDPAGGDQTELYASFGSAPTRSEFDYAATGGGASHSIGISNAYAGTWYILVYTDSVPKAPSSFTIAATSSPFVVTGVSPDQSAEGLLLVPPYVPVAMAPAADPPAQVTLTVTGAGFDPSTTACLIAKGGTIYPLETTFDTPTQLTATFSAGTESGPPAGIYSILVTRDDGATGDLSDAFTLIGGASVGYESRSDPNDSYAGLFQTQLVLPAVVGRHTPATFYMECTNMTDIALPAPLLLLGSSVPDDLPLFTSNPSLLALGLYGAILPAGFSNAFQALASGKVPGWIGPHETVTIPVYYAGMEQPYNLNETQFQFELQVVTSADIDPVNWNAFQASSQPLGISTAGWNAIYANLTSQLGGTWGSYVQFLDNEASYLGQLGENVTDISTLWNFAVQQADNSESPLGPYLMSVTDDSVAMPGTLSLSFSRVFAESIAGREAMGPLGMGWSNSWDMSTSVASDGTATTTDPGGGQEIFVPDSRTLGTYFSQPGDPNTLTADGLGGYLLTQPDGMATDYSPNGTLNYMQDTDGNRITAGYTDGRLTSLTASSGQSITMGYNSAGLISSVTDSQGRTTTYTYDSTDTYLIAVTGYNGQTTTYSYDTGTDPAQNTPTEIAFPGGTHQYFTYDSERRLASTYSDGGAEPLTFAYNLGEVDATDGTGDTTKFFYNEQGLLVKTIDPPGNVTFSTHDADGNLVNLTDAQGQSATFTYNGVGEVTSMTDFLGNTTTFSYGGRFNALSSMTNANGNTTQYAYDGSGDPLTTTYANGTGETYTYNPEGEAISYVDPDGQPINYTYNAAGQVTSETFSDGSPYTYSYDSLGDLISATDSIGTTTFTYDSASELLTGVFYPNGTSLTFTYNAGGQRTQMVDQTGFTVSYIYDQVGRLSELTDGNGNPLVTYTYDADGRLSEKLNGNGTYTTYTYDADENVLSLINYAPNGTTNSEFLYTYNSVGLETSEATLDGTWTYNYDTDGELTQAVFASTDPSIPSQNLVYTYDAVGNRTSTVLNGVTTVYVTNDMNQYTSVGATPYVYDANGNLLSDGTNTYTYNLLNELTSVTGSDGTTTYTYNALGQQVASTTNGVTTEYLNDPTGIGNLVGASTGGGTVIAHYTYGLGLTSQVTANGSYYYDFDAVGSTAGVSNDVGGYVDAYSYQPYGGSEAIASSVANPFQYVGEFGVLEEAGPTDFMRARTYLPSIGAFASIDPLGVAGGLNSYQYAQDSPVNLVDPSGLFPKSETGFPDEFRKQPPGAYDPGPAILLKIFAYTIGTGLEVVTLPEGSPLWTRVTFEVIKLIVPSVLTPQSSAVVHAVQSADPNSMLGPAGFGPENVVAEDSLLPYQIDFENSSLANAPAQSVTITDQLSSDLDWSTFKLTGIGWGDTVLTIPPGSQTFETTVSMTYNGETFDVEVDAGINAGTGVVYATFQSIDSKTGLPPEALTGFLPPENGTGQGMGYVSFLIQPNAGLATGTQITNVALISFDEQPSIATDQVNDEDPSQGVDPSKQALVTIDSVPPSSSVAPLPAVEPSTAFTVCWLGQDDPGGSGIAYYDIYVSVNGGPYAIWQDETTATSASFAGQVGDTYAFYGVATDNVGNIQPTPTAAQATTEIVSVATPTLTISDAGGIFDGQAFPASGTATVTDGSTVDGTFAFTYYFGSTASGQGSTSAPTTAGTYTVVAAFTSSDPDYSDTESAPVTFTIDQATPGVMVTDAGGVFNGSSFPATATIAGVVSGADNTPGSSLEGVPLVLSYYVGTNIAGTPLSGAPSAAGSYTVVALFAGSQDYEGTSNQTSFVISQATPNVVATDAGGTYDGNAFPASATATGVGDASVSGTFGFTYYVGSSASGQGSSTAPIAAGTYTVVAVFSSSDPDYVAGPTDSAPLTFTISPATPTITVSDAGGTYDGNPFAASGTATGVGGATVSGSFGFSYYVGSTATGTASTTAPTNAGTYTVVAAFTSSNSNYVTGPTDSAPVTFKIGQATPTVVATDAGGTYNGDPFPAAATATGVGGATVSGTFAFTYYAGTSASGTGTSPAPTNVGTYTVVAAFTSTNTNYITGPTDSAPLTFTISAATGPIIMAPSTASVNEDSSLVFSAANGNAISVTDSKAGSGKEQLTLIATHGTITLSSAKGVTATGPGADASSGSPSITIKGTLASLNAALNGLKFTPTIGYSGFASLAISYKDLGDNRMASATVAITVVVPASEPTVTIKEFLPVAVPGEPVPFLLEVSDTNAAAQAAAFTFAVSFGDGKSTTFSSKSPVLINHVYTKTGTFTVSVTATDEYGHTSAPATATIKVVSVAVESDPFNSSQTALYVGTSGTAAISFAASGNGGIGVTLNGASEGTYSTGGPILVFGQGGKDTIRESAGLKNSVDVLQSPTADNVETDLDNEALKWAGLTAAIGILNA